MEDAHASITATVNVMPLNVSDVAGTTRSTTSLMPTTSTAAAETTTLPDGWLATSSTSSRVTTSTASLPCPTSFETFKPVGIEKYDGESEPKMWLRIYSVAV